jgi:molybdate transport system substrate-binding protein
VWISRRVVYLSALLAPLLTAAIGVCACGGEGARDSAQASPLVVSAASSLKVPLERYAEQLHRSAGVSVRYSFAGSDLLAAQIEAGLRPDVFASANLKLPRRLHARGLVEAPVVFGGNRLVLAVAQGSNDVKALGDLVRRGVTLAVGSPTVPVGEYTRTVISRLPPRLRQAVVASIRDEEPDVAGIVGKLSQGAVDAGFAYASDVTAAKGALRAVAIPASIAPAVAYAAAVVKDTGQAARARAFIAALVRGAGRDALARAGFLPPPRA